MAAPLRERLGFDTEPLYLIDGTAFVFRGFYAFQDMRRSDGFPTNALFSVLRLLLRLAREERPRYLGFFLDGKGPTFRHELYGEYKANRSATPEPLIQQLAPVREAAELLGFPVVVSEGCEADDCLASLAARCKGDRPVVIVGADKDLKQCLDERVVLWDPSGKNEKITTLEDFREDTGLEPDQWADFQAVIGDSSDNIPGIPGVGPKTAAKWFADFPTLEALRDGMDALPAKQKAKVEENKDIIFTFRELTTLRTDMCPTVDLEALRRKPVNYEGLVGFLQEYELRVLAREVLRDAEKGNLGPMDDEAAPTKAQAAAVASVSVGGGGAGGAEQLSLFGAPPAVEDDTPEVKNVSQAAELPDFSGKEVGLVALDSGGFGLGAGASGADDAVDAENLVYTGPVSGLAKALTPAAMVFCPDVKALLRTDDFWNALDLERVFDLGLAAYLNNPEERDYSWRKLGERLGPELYAHPKADGPLALDMGRLMVAHLRAGGLLELMRTLEMRLIPVLAAMEVRGVRIDGQAFAAFLNEVREELTGLEKRVIDAAGRPFNVRSSQQLGEILFKDLGLKPAGKTATGAASTSQAALEKLAGKHEIVDLVLEYRVLEKLRSTYLEPLPKLADGSGRIHTTFNQLATATGRLSSSSPNLQNIPIRGKHGGRMRSCFVSEPGMLLAAADYSQIELRVLAHMSQDPTLLDAFANDLDIHASTAAVLHEKDVADVTVSERRGAKTVNFGLLYGMGPQKLGQELGVGMKEAKAFIERYFERLGKLKAFYDQVVDEAREAGFVTTLAGRRRLLPEIHSQNNQLQSLARRQAINTLIQGSAADIIKLAMLDVEADKDLADLDARLILQVHDELLLEVPEANAKAAGQRMADLMTNVTITHDGQPIQGKSGLLDVPLKVDWGVGPNWDVAH